jgi:hypothetical protein
MLSSIWAPFGSMSFQKDGFQGSCAVLNVRRSGRVAFGISVVGRSVALGGWTVGGGAAGGAPGHPRLPGQGMP